MDAAIFLQRRSSGGRDRTGIRLEIPHLLLNDPLKLYKVVCRLCAALLWMSPRVKSLIHIPFPLDLFGLAQTSWVAVGAVNGGVQFARSILGPSELANRSISVVPGCGYH